ncbi:MAG: hypothetical protein JW973_04470, partial [Bacteroidales bacterium]|nr:hypothetical protein [Bacteroidales bacterium]
LYNSPNLKVGAIELTFIVSFWAMVSTLNSHYILYFKISLLFFNFNSTMVRPDVEFLSKAMHKTD